MTTENALADRVDVLKKYLVDIGPMATLVLALGELVKLRDEVADDGVKVKLGGILFMLRNALDAVLADDGADERKTT